MVSEASVLQTREESDLGSSDQNARYRAEPFKLYRTNLFPYFDRPHQRVELPHKRSEPRYLPGSPNGCQVGPEFPWWQGEGCFPPGSMSGFEASGGSGH